MGEAKRRKQLDPNFGKKSFSANDFLLLNNKVQSLMIENLNRYILIIDTLLCHQAFAQEPQRVDEDMFDYIKYHSPWFFGLEFEKLNDFMHSLEYFIDYLLGVNEENAN